jgi:hypothetical protein
MTGGRVCSAHGGRALQVRAAAARRWLLERARPPLDGFELAYLWYRFSPDPATWCRHRRTRPVSV